MARPPEAVIAADPQLLAPPRSEAVNSPQTDAPAAANPLGRSPAPMPLDAPGYQSHFCLPISTWFDPPSQDYGSVLHDSYMNHSLSKKNLLDAVQRAFLAPWGSIAESSLANILEHRVDPRSPPVVACRSRSERVSLPPARTALRSAG